MKYVGEIKRIIKFRFAEHRGYVNNNDDTATGEHFNMPGHSLSDMTLTVLEKVRSSDDFFFIIWPGMPRTDIFVDNIGLLQHNSGV